MQLVTNISKVTKSYNTHFTYILLFSLSSFYFFSPYGISTNAMKIVFGLFLLFLLPAALKAIFSDKSAIGYAIKLLMIGVILSTFVAAFSWHQGIIISVFAATYMFTYLLFFYLLRHKVKPPVIEKIIIVLGISFVIVYTISILSYPIPIFGDVYHYDTQRGFQRIISNGAGFLFLALFLSLNKYI